MRSPGIVFFACASAASVLPPVRGRTDYFRPTPPEDCCSPGTLVKPGQFDHGNIPIGNGAPNANWVRDDIRASVMTLRHGSAATALTLVLVSVDVYMLFRQDTEAIHERVRRQLGETGTLPVCSPGACFESNLVGFLFVPWKVSAVECHQLTAAETEADLICHPNIWKRVRQTFKAIIQTAVRLPCRVAKRTSGNFVTAIWMCHSAARPP